MDIWIDMTDYLVAAVNWDIVVKAITHRVRVCMYCPDTMPIICVQHYLRDTLFKSWASVYLRTTYRDNLRTRLVKWIAKSLNVDISTDEQRRLSVSQEVVQRLRDTMIERESLIVDGFWVRVVSL